MLRLWSLTSVFVGFFGPGMSEARMAVSEAAQSVFAVLDKYVFLMNLYLGFVELIQQKQPFLVSSDILMQSGTG